MKITKTGEYLTTVPVGVKWLANKLLARKNKSQTETVHKCKKN